MKMARTVQLSVNNAHSQTDVTILHKFLTVWPQCSNRVASLSLTARVTTDCSAPTYNSEPEDNMLTDERINGHPVEVEKIPKVSSLSNT
jgi:hypothetical protein